MLSPRKFPLGLQIAQRRVVLRLTGAMLRLRVDVAAVMTGEACQGSDVIIEDFFYLWWGKLFAAFSHKLDEVGGITEVVLIG